MSDTQSGYSVIKMYAPRQEIYPREIKGRYATLRWVCVWLTQLVFYGFPWLSWNGRPAVLFDLIHRKFYIFGYVLWPQDFFYLAMLLMICAYALFLFTAVAGRLWCGFACPQTVYTEMFLWIERKIEGTRSARMRLAKQPWTAEKLTKKIVKHGLWIALAGWTGFTFVSYFTPIHSLATEVEHAAMGPWEWFWIVFYSFATYGNAGWMREQVCKYMCPYARFQSAMFDKDTLIVTYDKARGEPRGARAKGEADKQLGDCIDCSMCVQVCPTGIDIRQGLQYECIGCAACVDACNSVMDKVDLPRGLVRFATENALKNKYTPKQIRAHALRPRVLIYTAILIVVSVALLTSLALRTPLKLDILRDRGSLGREVEEGMIENVYRLQVMNTDEQPHHYHVKAVGIEGLRIEPSDDIAVDATSTRAVPVRLRIPHGAAPAGSNKIRIELEATDRPDLHVSEKAVFLVPR